VACELELPDRVVLQVLFPILNDSVHRDAEVCFLLRFSDLLLSERGRVVAYCLIPPTAVRALLVIKMPSTFES
jgi:hypothetical protein